MKLLAIAFLLVAYIHALAAQNLTSVPSCAQTCLGNATAAQGACSSLDIKCLCGNQNYVNSLSCCLATICSGDDQQKAILFNQETCSSVNETAPGFVGCSPLGLTSQVGLGSDSSSSVPETSISSSLTGTSTSTNSLVSIVSGDIESALTTFIGSVPVTATYTGEPLLTGTCSIPFFAQVTDSMGMVTMFPQVGCTHDQEGCCPYDSHENAVLSDCPHDYITTASACCPFGWQVYFAALGGQTPCYTMPSVTLVPATTPTVAGITVITEHIFTRRYELASIVEKKSGLAPGAEAGIAVGGFLALCVLGCLAFLFLRGRKAKKAAASGTAAPPLGTSPEQDKALGSPSDPSGFGGAHELASPQNFRSPKPVSDNWPVASPPAYNFNPQVEVPRPKRPQALQELPGSTFILEHHPAFVGPVGVANPIIPAPSSPRSPPRPATASSPVVSPLASPKQREAAA